MKIGIVGPRDSVENIGSKLLKVDKNIEYIHYIREEVSKVAEVIDQCEKEVDGIILSGAGVHSTIKKYKHLKKPSAYIHRKAQSIISTLWKVKKDFENLGNFSIDVVTQEALDEAIEELDIPSNSIQIMPFSHTHKEDEYILWHKKLFDENKIDFILTGFGAVYSKLKEDGYPVYRLMPTFSQVKDAYNTIIHKTQISKLQSSQIAVQIIKLTKKTNENYYEELSVQNILEKEIISYVREVQGALYSSGRDEYIIFGTKGSFKNTINSFNKLITNVKFEISSGIGYGGTAYEADTNARNALLASIKENGIFIIDETSTLIGPIDLSKEHLSPLDEKVKKISLQTSISSPHIYKIIQLLDRKGASTIDSKELAGFLEISERSARRIINKFIDSGLGVLEVGEHLSKGRPKNVIKLSF